RRIDPVVGTVTFRGERSSLSRKQLEVLALLAGAEGRAVSRDDFIGQVWDGDHGVGDRGLTNIVYELRRDLRDTNSDEPLIRTLPRRGYQLNAEAHTVPGDGSPSFVGGWQVPGRPEWQLDELLSRTDVVETWSARRPGTLERRVFRFCRSEEHLRRLRREVTAHDVDHEGLVGWQLDEPPYFLEMESAALGGDPPEQGHGAEALWPEPGESARAPTPPVGVGQSIGPYRLLDVLGEGGMGTVYLAEQRRPVERRVALKLIKAGMDGAQVLARFEAERQALALMDHDNVAAVHDAGSSDSGHPFFVMEYVPGLDITSHCDRARLGLRARIELFAQVCDGVQHAHQKGVIHRDLKPSNLLVKKPAGQHATVKIIDFGVAKSLQRKLGLHTVHTRLGTFVGTPRYSSPEQICDHLADADTRSDVYSLGIVLYELVAGVTPRGAEELAGKSSAELAKILGEEPPTPRSRFTDLDPQRKEEIASNRSRSVEELEQRLDADVSWIILKCLEPEPDDRYPSVLEVKKDLLRWLADQPIEARPTTGLYRLGKWVRRHRTAVAAAALTSLALVATTGVAVVGFVRAEQEAGKAREAALEAEKAAEFQVRQLRSIDPSSMAAGLRESLRQAVGEQRGGSTATGEDQRQLDQLLQGVDFTDLLLEQLDGYFFEPALREIESGYEDFPLLQTRLWHATAETLATWGQFERALEIQEMALAQRRSLLGDGDPLSLASLHHRGALRRELGQLEEAKADIQTAAAGLERRLGVEDPSTLSVLSDLGLLMIDRGELEAAEPLLRDVLRGRKRVLGTQHLDTLKSLHNLGALFLARGDLGEAEAFYREALAGRRELFGEDHIDTLRAIDALAIVLHYQGKVDEAEAYHRRSLAGFRRLRGHAHVVTLNSAQNLASVLVKTGKTDEAEQLHRESLGAKRRLLGDDHPSTLTSIANFGSLLDRRGQASESEAHLREALLGRRRVLGPEHPQTLVSINNLATLLRKRGQLDEAEALAREVLEAFQRTFGAEHRNTLRCQRSLGQVLREQGRFDEAEFLLGKALEAQRRTLGDDHPDTLLTMGATGDLFQKWGKPGDAEPYYREVLAGYRQVHGEDHPKTVRNRESLANVLRRQGRLEEAARLGGGAGGRGATGQS
ncbi:MAG: tetratricopeptide repeat protein, partial [Acidobacteriota bacterium]